MFKSQYALKNKHQTLIKSTFEKCIIILVIAAIKVITRFILLIIYIKVKILGNVVYIALQ